MNPILPIQHFVPDVEARQWADGRLYLYGSYDISGRTSYCRCGGEMSGHARNRRARRLSRLPRPRRQVRHPEVRPGATV